jgi:hypothetical protein
MKKKALSPIVASNRLVISKTYLKIGRLLGRSFYSIYQNPIDSKEFLWHLILTCDGAAADLLPTIQRHVLDASSG